MKPNLDYLNKHLEKVRSFYDQAPTETTWMGRFYKRLLASYYQYLIPASAQVLEVGCGSGELLALLPHRKITGMDISSKQIEAARQRLPHAQFIVGAAESLGVTYPVDQKFDIIILSETINYGVDVQGILERLQSVSHPHTRLILNFYSSLWRPFLTLATFFGIKPKHPEANWLSHSDVRNLLELGAWDLIKEQPKILCPLPLLGLDHLLNKYVAPWVPSLCVTVFQIARPRQNQQQEKTVSVIIPARNEAGNIAAAVARTPKMGAKTEIIFIEGNSTDNTWETLQRTASEHPEIVIMQQTGKGKGNAVREAFERATGDILMILDADLTVPPEELPKFYSVLASGQADFANGVRLVYPMEDQAMRFLNMCANKFFSLAFSWILGQPIKDTLCGTKVLYKSDYQKLAANRSYFGEFDPFGDFDLIFGASKMNLKMVDIPIRYKERTYGETNISRWSHGWLLLKMVVFSLKKIKFI